MNYKAIQKLSKLLGLFGAGLLICVCLMSAQRVAADSHLYVLSNQTKNSVLRFSVSDEGRIQHAGEFFTSGKGIRQSLGNQGALFIDAKDNLLFTVNPGSHEVSSFRIVKQGLTLLNTISSGGEMPVSVAQRGNFVYVLNQGADKSPSNVSGFAIQGNGTLQPLAGSTRMLSAALSEPAQVLFTPIAHKIIVTEVGQNKIDVFSLNPSTGLLSNPVFNNSYGVGPFGFDFDSSGNLLVSNEGRDRTASVTTYRIGSDNKLRLLSAPVFAPNQKASCWLETLKLGKLNLAVVTNTASDTVSLYNVSSDGKVRVASAIAARSGPEPIDLTIFRKNRLVGILNGETASSLNVAIFSIVNGKTVQLRRIGAIGGLPKGSSGIVAE